MKHITNNSPQAPRPGCKDVWNAFMVKNSAFTENSDIPFCPCTTAIAPVNLISYDDAKSLYNKEQKSGNHNFQINSFIHFYIDDQKFDGKRNSIWLYPQKALTVIQHFSGIITPDFSTNSDFPDPLKRFNTYRMRAFGCWVASQGIPVINNVRWGTAETWNYCFDGIPSNSIVSIGTVASGLRCRDNKNVFESGLKELVNRLSPHTIIIYGSANCATLHELEDRGIKIVPFHSRTYLALNGGMSI